MKTTQKVAFGPGERGTCTGGVCRRHRKFGHLHIGRRPCRQLVADAFAIRRAVVIEQKSGNRSGKTASLKLSVVHKTYADGRPVRLLVLEK